MLAVGVGGVLLLAKFFGGCYHGSPTKRAEAQGEIVRAKAADQQTLQALAVETVSTLKAHHPFDRRLETEGAVRVRTGPALAHGVSPAHT